MNIELNNEEALRLSKQRYLDSICKIETILGVLSRSKDKSYNDSCKGMLTDATDLKRAADSIFNEIVEAAERHLNG